MGLSKAVFHRYLPSPTANFAKLGVITLHYYALCILIGIIAALVIGSHRWRKAKGDPSELLEMAIYVIPAGVVGGRLYHVLTTPELYFGKGGHPIDALKIWQGGMGIWGAVALGALTTYLLFKIKPRSVTFATAADALAPALLVAQGIGRWGNWFNKELFGSPSTLPWALKIPTAYRPHGFENFATFHPTFLYESIWCILAAAALIFTPQVKKLRAGSTFLLYVLLYSVGRIWIEALRIDRAHLLLGVRLNVWVALLCAVVSLVAIVRRQHRHFKRPISELTSHL